jgi:hypothetical protein
MLKLELATTLAPPLEITTTWTFGVDGNAGGTTQSSPPALAFVAGESVATLITELFGSVAMSSTETVPTVSAAVHRTSPTVPRCQTVHEAGRVMA